MISSSGVGVPKQQLEISRNLKDKGIKDFEYCLLVRILGKMCLK